ncbi:hypothetical protein pb186bvf_016299 [Paramecium bursaria]
MGNMKDKCPCIFYQSEEQKSSAQSFFVDVDNESQKGKFRYDTDSKFYGYPNHKELKAKLYEIQESHASWAPHEKGLNDNLKRLQAYLKFIKDIDESVVDILISGLQVIQKIKFNHINLPIQFKSDFQHSFLVEIQDILIQTDELKNSSILVSFSLQNPEFGIDQRFETTNYQLVKSRIKADFFKQVFISTIDEEELKSTYTIKTPYKFFNQFYFSIQFFKFTSSDPIPLGRSITFNVIDLKSQEIFEKVISIQNEQQQVILKAQLRFQLLHNLKKFTDMWIEELEIRETEIQKMLKKLHHRSDKQNLDGSDLIQSALWSSNGLNQSRAESAYDIPYVIK